MGGACARGDGARPCSRLPAAACCTASGCAARPPPMRHCRAGGGAAGGAHGGRNRGAGAGPAPRDPGAAGLSAARRVARRGAPRRTLGQNHLRRQVAPPALLCAARVCSRARPHARTALTYALLRRRPHACLAPPPLPPPSPNLHVHVAAARTARTRQQRRCAADSEFGAGLHPGRHLLSGRESGYACMHSCVCLCVCVCARACARTPSRTASMADGIYT